MPPRRNHLVIMVKEPRLGHVKTRLARDVGSVAATRTYRLMLAQALNRLPDPARWTTHLAIAPPGRGDVRGLFAQSPTLRAAAFQRFQQKGVTLGDRMCHAFRTGGTGRSGPGKVVIIGSDCPGIQRSDIARAFDRLAHAPFVLGPSPDGGYWLIGCTTANALRARVLAGVRWSSPHARADTRQRLGALRPDAQVAELRTLEDCDDGASLRRLSRLVERRIAGPGDCNGACLVATGLR